MLKQEALLALDVATSRGATYADARAIAHRQERIHVRNGKIGDITQRETVGVGVRVIKSGAWGFACTDDLTREGIETCAARAVRVAEASALCKSENVRLSQDQAHEDFWATPCAIDPFKVSLEDKINLLMSIDRVLREKPQIKVASSKMYFDREDQWFVSSDGAAIHQIITTSGAGYDAQAVEGRECQRRSYPASFGGNYKTMGYELVHHYDLLGNAPRIRDEAIALLSAPECPSGKTTLILDGPQMALQIHESVGHANELDRVLGFEANFAGRSFMLPELSREGFRYGSEIVNLVADSTAPGGLGTIGYDDDGVRAKRFHIVQNGMHRSWFTTRETAPMIREEESNGCNRAEGFENIPITRIPNLSLMPGSSSLDEMIAGTDDGVLMEVNKSWSIDQMRLNFQFGCEIGRIIRGGKVVGICKNPSYQGMTPEFWGSCDAIGNADEWDLWGVINCGKGQPMQTAAMSHGSAPTRFRNVMVGIR